MGDYTPLTHDEAKNLCKSPGNVTKNFMFQQTMYRIKNPRLTIPFYTGVLGMKLLQKWDFPEMKFSIFMFGYEPITNESGDFGTKQRSTWTLKQNASLELTHNWGTENDPDFHYHPGNTEPRGFGHIGLNVPDVDAACKHFEQLGVEFIKKPGEGKIKCLAFVKDPDGYWIEIFNNAVVADAIHN